MALNGKSTRTSTGVGLRDLGKAHPAAAAIEGATGLVLGSGVAIAPRWILSAAHVFRGPQLRVWAISWGKEHRVGVRAVHWRDASYTFRAAGDTGSAVPPWPEQVADRQGERDELVLLELDDDLALDADAYAKPDAAPYVPGTKLHIVGFGLDGDGNYDPRSIPTIMRMVSQAPDRVGFGLCRSDRQEGLGIDMPRQDDSGAPVFLAGSRRVVGIHSLRFKATDAASGLEKETACFIAVTQASLAWIDSLTSLAASPKAATLPASTTKPQRFVLRARHGCLTLTEGHRSLDGIWHLNGTSADPSILLLCDRIEIAKDGGGTSFSLYRCGATAPFYVGQADPGGDSKVSNAWLHVRHRPDYPAIEYFVFRRTDGWLPVRQPDGSSRTELTRRIHIEAFLDNSLHQKPHGKLEFGGGEEEYQDIVPCEGCMGALKIGVNDQDDEGDAYEG
jgi:hypothetical protein